MTDDHDTASEALTAAADLDDPVDALEGSVDHVEGTVAEVVAAHAEQRARVAWGKANDPDEVRDASVERANETAGLAVVAYAAAAPDEETAAERAAAARSLLNDAATAAREAAARDAGQSAVVDRVADLAADLPPGEEDAAATLLELRDGYDEQVERVHSPTDRGEERAR